MKIERILIVGLGSIGKRHLRLARMFFPGADIRVLRHQIEAKVPEYSNGCYYNIQDAINFAPQIAVIASPAPFHITCALALTEVGVHLLIEKPLSNNLEGVVDLLELSKLKGTVLLTGYNLRFMASLQHFRNMLGEGIVGKVLSVRSEIGQYLPSWRLDKDYQHCVSAKAELGGGVLLELSHEIDYLRWIFGETQWVSATLGRQSNLEIDVEDTAHLCLGFARLDCGHQLIGAVTLDFIRHDVTRYCIAIGEKGTLRWDGIKNQVSIYLKHSNCWDQIFSEHQQRDDSYIAEWQNFIDSVTNGIAPLVSGLDGLRVLQIIKAVRHSAAINSRVMVEHG